MRCSAFSPSHFLYFFLYSLSLRKGTLGVKSLSTNTAGLLLQATSIHGEGDKISLPPSVLQILTQSLDYAENPMQQQQPWTFRLAIRNPQYTFPMSSQLLLPSVALGISSDYENTDKNSNDDDDDDDEVDDTLDMSAYLDELQHKYLAYTHATVVEFTQDEGHIGLPEPIAKALTHPAIALTRTVDMASADTSRSTEMNQNIDHTINKNENNDDSVERTPGHLAWGAFDVPLDLVHVSLIQLPKGRAAKLQPSVEAIRNGFYNLKNIKLVLEQSLVRTRATISVGDTIHTWHRGIKFDLKVTHVTPNDYQSVSCINTDIEIDFETQPLEENENTKAPVSDNNKNNVAGVGRRLGDDIIKATPSDMVNTPLLHTQELLPEPPTDQVENILIAQIRTAKGDRGQRRFDIFNATIGDLFKFAVSVQNSASGSKDENVPLPMFCLVTRHPRRVATLDNATLTLNDFGVTSGQELFLVEPM